MSRTDHWKNYEPIENVMAFNDNGAGPTFERLQVIANVHPSALYPNQRISVLIGNLASASMTDEQAYQLIGLLQRARDDARAGSDLGQEQDDG